MIKQIFTWWNYQTFGTFLYTLFFGKFVGKDNSGNKYYQNNKGKRWVIYNGETIWYDNVRIYRQKVQGDWSEVFNRVEKDCTELIKNISEIRNS